MSRVSDNMKPVPGQGDEDTASFDDLEVWADPELNWEPGLGANAMRLLEAAAGHGAPFYIADIDGALLFTNDAFRRRIGGLAGPETPTIVPLSAIREALEGAGAMDQDGIVVELGHRVWKGRDGAYLISIHAVIPDETGGNQLLTGCYQDITEQIVARRSATLAQQRLSDIIRLVSDWIWETDRAGRFSYVSPRVYEALGYHQRELLGREMASLIQVPAEFGAALPFQARQPFRDILAYIHPREAAGSETVSTDPRLFELSGLPMFSPSTGSFIGYRGIAKDVTDTHNREAVLRQSMERAELANVAKSEFIANVTHELRTPLNAIIGFSEVIREESHGPLGAPEYQEFVRCILESGRHLLALINDILDMARAESGVMALEEETFDLREIVLAVIRLTQERAWRAQVSVVSKVPESLPNIIGDERKIRQILINLVGNSIKFTEAGGQVVVAARIAKDGGLDMTVEDNGIGISKENVEKAMSRFGQVDSQLSRQFEGTGLGLPLSEALAQAHGGSLTLESAPGVGTKVTIWLPPSRLAED